MKKIIILVFLTLFLSSCFWDSQEVIKAKKDLWIIKENPKVLQQETPQDLQQKKAKNTINDLSEDPRISITQISGKPLLKLDPLKYSDFKNWYAKITGTTLWQVDKIKVDFSNENSIYPNNSFVLKKFKSWWKTFLYNANSKYKVLDFWLNKYLFTAYSWDSKSVLELKVLVSVNDDEYLDWKTKKQNSFEKQEETKKTELIWDENDLVFTKLPEWGDFWNVVKLWEKSFTYSDIKWLEIKKEILSKINCTKNEDTDEYFVTEFLSDRQKSYYYWNTCRDLIKDKGISFYVIRLDWDKYFYEKHYIDLVHWFYWIYELESWEWVNKDNISEKNKELKAKNREFKNTEIVDNLFKKIINNN